MVKIPTPETIEMRERALAHHAAYQTFRPVRFMRWFIRRPISDQRRLLSMPIAEANRERKIRRKITWGLK